MNREFFSRLVKIFQVRPQNYPHVFLRPDNSFLIPTLVNHAISNWPQAHPPDFLGGDSFVREKMDPLPQASWSHVTLEEPAATGSSPMTVTARRYPTPEEGLLRLSRIEGAFKRSSWHRVGAFYSQYRGHSPCDENNRGWII